jgi:hypothetical protein
MWLSRGPANPELGPLDHSRHILVETSAKPVLRIDRHSGQLVVGLHELLHVASERRTSAILAPVLETRCLCGNLSRLYVRWGS